jgi:hypothetical protein
MVTQSREGDAASGVMAHPWALLVYTLPRVPSGVLLHDAVWVLPGKPALIEHFRWLASDIREAGGEALVWNAEQGLPDQDDTLIRIFLAQAEVEYQGLLAALDEPEVDRAALALRYKRVLVTDYFHAPSSDAVRARLEGGTA